MDATKERLRGRLTELGFDEVRFAALSPPPGAGLRQWLAGGRQADMAWMERTEDKRLDPELVLPGALSVVALGISYAGAPAAEPGPAPIWARYALHRDYHDTVKPALAAAGRVLEEECGIGGQDYRYYVDTGPVLERHWAARAGLGFIGKNAMLISRRHGNWLLLSAILTRVAFEPDPPLGRRTGAEVGLLCGKCTRCLDACPTRAFDGPGLLDARRCISYQTIENRGVIPRELRPGIGRRVFGCDVCLEVCPWNRFARAGRVQLLAARGDLAKLSLRELLELTPERFRELFRGTPMERTKLRGILRNACVAAGNAGDPELLEPVLRLATHPEPMVRAHAVWAARRLGGGERLASARAAESHPQVAAEYLD